MAHPIFLYRRNLPHLRVSGAVYFVTWRLTLHQSPLEEGERAAVLAVLGHFCGERYNLGAHVVMDDHVHVLVCPNSGHPLTEIIHSWKSYSAHVPQRQHGRSGTVWQKESFDRVVRDLRELQAKTQYIEHNPFKRWPSLTQYAWVHGGNLFPGKDAGEGKASPCEGLSGGGTE